MRSCRALIALTILLVVQFSSTATGQTTLRLSTTGDSMANGWGHVERIGAQIESADLPIALTMVASRGADSPRYLGRTIDPHTETIRMMHQEVTDSDPDVIAFMLGTNDAKSGNIALFKDDMTRVFDHFQQFTNSRGNSPEVILVTPTPVIRPSWAHAELNLQIHINPWLRAEAHSRGFHLVDMYEEIQAFDDWQSLYNDGIHFWKDDRKGFNYIASRVLQEVLDLGLTEFSFPGDYNADSVLDVDDLNTLSSKIAAGATDAKYDLNDDGRVDLGDHTYWLRRLNGSRPGDANLDRSFTTRDLVSVFEAGKYEDATQNANWQAGDWNADGVFSSRDLVAALEFGGIDTTAPPLVVPEPSSSYGGYLVLAYFVWVTGQASRRCRPFAEQNEFSR